MCDAWLLCTFVDVDGCARTSSSLSPALSALPARSYHLSCALTPHAARLPRPFSGPPPPKPPSASTLRRPSSYSGTMATLGCAAAAAAVAASSSVGSMGPPPPPGERSRSRSYSAGHTSSFMQAGFDPSSASPAADPAHGPSAEANASMANEGLASGLLRQQLKQQEELEQAQRLMPPPPPPRMPAHPQPSPSQPPSHSCMPGGGPEPMDI